MAFSATIRRGCKSLVQNSPWRIRASQHKSSEDKEKIIKTMFRITNTQVNLYVAERCRRLVKVYTLYRQVYNDFTKSSLWRRIVGRTKISSMYPLALSAAAFSWKDNELSEDEIKHQMDDWEALKKILNDNNENEDKNTPLIALNITECDEEQRLQNWSVVIDEPNVKAWTCPYKDTSFLEYKVYGRFHDISARTFFQVQTDIEYRREWDNTVVEMNIIDENKSTNETVIQWVSKFTFPLNPREYICLRKTKVEERNKLMTIFSRVVNYPGCEPCPQYVRVNRYQSYMLIQPHKTFDEPGFDYYLVYNDDPQLMISPGKLAWLLAKGLKDYINQLYSASKQLERKQKNNRIEPISHNNFENLNKETQNCYMVSTQS